MSRYVKIAGLAFMLLWLAVMGLDAFALIQWPDMRIKRIFVWAPTVVFGLYFLFFGGKSRESDKKDGM
ncbi:MAG: hypothetical protein RQ867_06030 [Mariprofundaceae bacterium]|nr:hypothetical protein [Mariprofundaceae bacterium]